MTAFDLVLAAAVFVFTAVFVGPQVGAARDRHRQRRHERARLHPINTHPASRAPVHFTRDPSPRPRRRAS